MPVCDSAARLLLFRAARKLKAPPEGLPVNRWLIVLPARAEGTRIERTLASIRDARSNAGVRILVILDGEDGTARDAAAAYGADVLVKRPAGPNKAAVLRWAAMNASAFLEAADAVLLLDVGSRLSQDFFDEFRWPGTAAVAQCFLDGCGDGIGTAIAASERFAQSVEDRGREQLGWNVRVRGTGTVFRPDAFAAVASRLITDAEDLETSLLLASDRIETRMAPPGARVADDKATTIASAAAQRARWLAGTAMILVRRFGTLAGFCLRRPAEGLAFLAHLFGRPLSLTVPIRFAAAVALIATSNDHPLAWPVAATVIVASVISDYASYRAALTVEWSSTAHVASAWVLAVPILPRTVGRWLRAKR